MLTQLGFFLSALFVTAFSIVLGGATLIMSWTSVTFERRRAGEWKIPRGLLTLSGSIGMALLSSVTPFIPMLGGSDAGAIHAYAGVARITYEFLLIVGFALIAIGVFLARNDAMPGSRAVCIGSRLLLAINILGLAGILASLPKLR